MSIPLSHRDGLRRQTSAFLGEGDTGDLPNDRLDDAGDLSDRALLDLITIPPQNVHTATVIWLHGLGDSGRGLQPFAQHLSRSLALGHIKWILPHAPLLSVTGNRGTIMNSWFDCYSFDIPNRTEDEAGLYKAVGRINDIVSAEMKNHNIPSDRIIIGGFSQGSAVSMLTALTTTRPLAGIFVLSGYIPLRKKAKQIASPIASSLPIFWCHGRYDHQVDYEFSLKAAETLASELDIQFRATNQRLAAEQFKVDGGKAGLTYVTYDQLGHWIQTPEEITDLHVWIEGCLPHHSADGVNEPGATTP